MDLLFEVLTNLPEVRAQLAGAAAAIPAEAAAQLALLAEPLKEAGLEALRAHTPVDTREESAETVHLQDTTAGEATISGDQALIRFEQTKPVPRWDGDETLAQLLERGHLGGYPIPTEGLAPMTSSALDQWLEERGLPIGVRLHLTGGSQAPNPYVADAMTELEVEILPARLSAAGNDLVMRVLSRL